ncbi:MAG: DUF2905 domain-containing protein [Candidatus Aureabacteria bacterium]|jgi:hypothetical protein|nr:DUF2905 domain-containing protein [Candidatus Auribacterota bacterium]
MDDLRLIGRYLIMAGVLLCIMGGLFLLSEKVTWLGHLPGDIHVERKNFRFYFPLGTCIALSVILSILLWLIRRR